MAPMIQVNQEFIDLLAEAIAKQNLKLGGILPHEERTEASQRPEAPADPWAAEAAEAPGTTPFSAAKDPWSPAPAATFVSPAEDPFSETKAAPADPWASDGLAEAIANARDENTLTALYQANKGEWNDNYTAMAKTRKGELNK